MLGAYSEEKAQDVIDKENRVDVYDDKITAYLTKLSSENLSYKDSLPGDIAAALYYGF